MKQGLFNARSISLLAILISISVVTRILLVGIPNFQATTFIIVMIGFVFGPIYSFVVAVLGCFISNLYLGMGIWTIGQILAWAIIGLLSGFLGKWYKRLPKFVIIIYMALCGYIFGFLMSLWTLMLSPISFIAYYIAGLPFDTNHAISNVLFYIIAGPIMLKILEKQKEKMVIYKK